MGKPKVSKKYVSKGQIGTNKHLSRMCRSDAKVDRSIRESKAWAAGKKGYVTIENPNKNETNKPFIKVPFKEYFGDFRENFYAIIK